MKALLMSVFTASLLLAFACQVYGHGNMYYPVAWHNQVANGRTFGPNPTRRDLRNARQFRGPSYPQPDTVCQGQKCSGCSIRGCATDWFTNHTFIPGEPTLPDDMYDANSAAGIEYKKRQKHPWTSPGTAPTFGEGCGANGGNPNGCQCKEAGPVNFCYGSDDRPYGSCCAQSEYRCGGYADGKSAMDHAADGLFDDAAVTRWRRGGTAVVIWKSGARHRGGYAYRLCKVPASGLSGVTEECFQNGHLEFAGPYTWIINKPGRGSRWSRRPAVRTTDIRGSQWTKINLPGIFQETGPWVWKDLVQVPQSLEAGEYVLSFRWDCQNTPQVWNSCATIQVV